MFNRLKSILKFIAIFLFSFRYSYPSVCAKFIDEQNAVQTIRPLEIGERAREKNTLRLTLSHLSSVKLVFIALPFQILVRQSDLFSKPFFLLSRCALTFTIKFIYTHETVQQFQLIYCIFFWTGLLVQANFVAYLLLSEAYAF